MIAADVVDRVAGLLFGVISWRAKKRCNVEFATGCPDQDRYR
jgi:hypothetical protein